MISYWLLIPSVIDAIYTMYDKAYSGKRYLANKIIEIVQGESKRREENEQWF